MLTKHLPSPKSVTIEKSQYKDVVCWCQLIFSLTMVVNEFVLVRYSGAF